MQIQEMYWKQKYDSLEENYKALKIECQKYQNMTKTTTGKIIILLFVIFIIVV